jgi:hypothetical protein
MLVLGFCKLEQISAQTQGDSCLVSGRKQQTYLVLEHKYWLGTMKIQVYLQKNLSRNEIAAYSCSVWRFFARWEDFTMLNSNIRPA